ncbi:hypothetical protein BJX70DRAFT_400637 [Aspergillus crustosus]
MPNHRLVVVVVGATGVQGRGVVEHLLAHTETTWTVRALTRDPHSLKSKALLSDLQTPDRPDGSVQFCDPIGADKGTQWLDGAHNIRIFTPGPSQTRDKNYIAAGPLLTTNDILATFTRVTGKRAYHDRISYEEFADIDAGVMGPAFRSSVLQMKMWAGETPQGKINYGCSEPEEDLSGELGVEVTGLEEWLRRTGFVGPEE